MRGAVPAWVAFEVLLCAYCANGVFPASVQSAGDIEAFALEHDAFLVGWDWWDAADGLWPYLCLPLPTAFSAAAHAVRSTSTALAPHPSSSVAAE